MKTLHLPSFWDAYLFVAPRRKWEQNIFGSNFDITNTKKSERGDKGVKKGSTVKKSKRASEVASEGGEDEALANKLQKRMKVAKSITKRERHGDTNQSCDLFNPSLIFSFRHNHR